MIRALFLVLEMYSGKENVCAFKGVKSIYKKEEKEEEEEGVMKKERGRNRGREWTINGNIQSNICHCLEENFSSIHLPLKRKGAVT